jgi:hypothetical protein
MRPLSSTAEETESSAPSMTILSQEYPKLTFQLIAPNTVKTEVWEGKSVSVKRDALPALRSWRRTKPLIVDCKGGRINRVDHL